MRDELQTDTTLVSCAKCHKDGSESMQHLDTSELDLQLQQLQTNLALCRSRENVGDRAKAHTNSALFVRQVTALTRRC